MAMASSSCWRMAGMEAPLLSLDSIEWLQVSVPSTSTYTANNDNSIVKDFASSITFGNPPSYFIWKTSRSRGNVLEFAVIRIHQLMAYALPSMLLEIVWCFIVYTLTISGVAYLIRLRSNLYYGTSSLVPASELLEYNTQLQPHSGATTAVAASEGCLLIGSSDGSISCFQLDILDPSTPVFVSELRDDPGFGRLWGILSRTVFISFVLILVLAPAGDSLPQKLSSYLDIEKLEKEFVLASAEYLLSLANIKWSFTGTDKPSTDLIDLLVESSSYDMVFTVILKFWKGSGLKRKDCKPYGLLLTSSEDDFVYDSLDTAAASQKSAGNSHWGILEHYPVRGKNEDKYKATNPRLPLIVAGTLLSADSQIDLPLCFGMAGNESNPASLFRLYVDHGRHTEAPNLLIEYMENLASIRPADIIRRKKPFAIWFPYTYVELLWGMLEDSIQMGHRSEQCEKLKKLLHGALSNHLNLWSRMMLNLVQASAAGLVAFVKLGHF
ncbi:hypothetical protein SASPL_126522 [Salvia splendens]|uniref:NUP160 C-terminal TPR domain-containing protein n=1 Tax=Salvia splendens TaxID=180675 RepID=A0A8X8ZQ43_SALSN|nr:hypothetical protein SASPL_126522 [Salvia splendens]